MYSSIKKYRISQTRQKMINSAYNVTNNNFINKIIELIDSLFNIILSLLSKISNLNPFKNNSQVNDVENSNENFTQLFNEYGNNENFKNIENTWINDYLGSLDNDLNNNKNEETDLP